MNEKIKLLDLLRNEIDKLKTSNSSLDGEVLELMFNATSRDIYKDVLWGSKINNEDEEEDMNAVIESLAELPPEAEAFMAAGLRAYKNMEIVRAAS
tara:strand:+ start:27960 stop:28247 length:288 start_codon:yes stop_codon:yes gene_type:complete